MTISLKWRHTKNTDDLSVWSAREYTVWGTGRWVGKKLVRNWSVYCGDKIIATEMGRLTEGKQFAQDHLNRIIDRAAQEANLITVKLTADQIRSASFAITRGISNMRKAERSKSIFEARRILDEALKSKDGLHD